MGKVPVLIVVVVAIFSPSCLGLSLSSRCPGGLLLRPPACKLAGSTNNLTIVTREEWRAQPPTEVVSLQTPTPNVVIHHTAIPGACYSKEDCCRAMRSMQRTHQEVNNWADIGYNFAVGSDGLVYEGRGWDARGAHAAGFNTQSLGIVLIGNWVSELPPNIQLKTAEQLISEGVRLRRISPNYNLVGHRQVRDTECPGNTLYEKISHWKHFNGSIDLVNND